MNSTEEYRWDAAKKRIDVSFRMQTAFGGPVKEIPQRATIVNGQPTDTAPGGINTRWSLTPSIGGVYVPFSLPYLIIDCAADYTTTIVGTPNRSILYVMTRTPSPTEETLSALLTTCERAGYDMSKVERVAHDSTDTSACADATLKGVSMPIPRTLPGRAFDGPPRLCMATMQPSHNSSNAKKVMDAISDVVSANFVTWYVAFPRGRASPYYAWVEALKQEFPDESRAAYKGRHGWSAPFIWLELPDGTRQPIGGRDALCAWALDTFPNEPKVVDAAKAPLRYIDSLSYSAKPGSALAPKYTIDTSDEAAPTPPPATSM